MKYSKWRLFTLDFVTAERTNAQVKMYLCMSRHAYWKALPP